MAWYSLLPEYLRTWETWTIRLFILLGILTIGPWAALVVFDIVFYIIRVIAFETPIIGGRAQGQRKPPAPTLTERPSGRRRAFSLRGEAATDEANQATTNLQIEMMKKLMQTDDEKKSRA